MSRVENILKQADMEIARTPSELGVWVNKKTRELCQTEEGRQFARSGAWLSKKLWEEVMPLSLFTSQRYDSRSDVKCSPNLGDENFDGKIVFDDKTIPAIYIEITYAKDFRDEKLRFEVMNQEGVVNLWGAASAPQTRAAGPRKVNVANEPDKTRVVHKKIRQCALENVRKRLVAKGGKPYGQNYELIVVVDDYLTFRTEEDRKILEEFAKAAIGGANLVFGKIFLLGSSGNYLKQIYGNT
jgi:hypothetical protein